MMPRGKLPDYRIRYEALLELTHDAVCLIDLDGNIIHGNSRAASVLGRSRDEIVGAPAKRFVAPSEHDEADLMHKALLAGDPMPLYHRTFVRPDGSTFKAEMDVALVRDARGEPAYIQSIIRDLSARRTEQEALRLIVEGAAADTGTHFFDSLVRHLAVILDMEHVLVAEWPDDASPVVKTLAFWSGNTLVGNIEYDVTDTPCGNVLDGTLRCYERDLQQRFPKATFLADLGAESYIGIPMRNAKAEIIGHLAALGNKPLRSPERAESIVRIFAARAGAVLERFYSQRALHESEARHRLLVEQIPVVTFIDPAGDTRSVRYISPQVEKVLGYPAEAWTQKEGLWRRLLHEDDRERVLESYNRSRERREPFKAEYRLRARDGRVVWVRSETAWVCDENGQPMFEQGILQDVTERRKFEEELLNARKLESVGLLAGGIAHDFNNLLMGILGNMKLAKLDLEPGSSPYIRLDKAEGVARRAKSLAHQLLSLSKGGAPVRRTTALTGQVQDTVDFVLSGSSVKAEIDMPDDLWPVDADVEQISQVIGNVTINAMQAMPGGGRIQVRAENVRIESGEHGKLAPGRYIRVGIADEGTGIRPEHLGKIFDPYFTTKETGSGLGLATAHAVISRHDGHIHVESEPGVGSIFWIYLPASDRSVTPAADVRDVDLSFSGRVLVMDDELTVGSVARDMLEQLGCACTVVREGAETVKLYRRELRNGRPFDVVILDLTIRGGVGGKETMRRLLEIDPQVRAIVSSGYSEDEVLSRHADFGFAACLVKPYDVRDLHEALCSAGRREAQHEGAPRVRENRSSPS